MVNVTQTDVSVDRSAPPSSAASLHLERGASVGRYVILDIVGEGGMGIVYSAYDPELDRKLALKLLRTSSSDRRAERRRLRLIREAQAMARLSHANVITVHDVGTIDDQVFVAMEFIEGCSLAEWIRMDHAWRPVVDVFVQAGEGLAAAHAAGLVHRDFKPDNVMLTGEHRAVVTDFGLARASGRSGASESCDPDGLGGPPRASLSTTVTAAGAIMGTPAYMSPEQHEGREVDARSDQFAFAVALYEALYGVRPFPGEDVASLAYNVGAGNVRPAPSRSSVPGWLRQVLTRALSVEPSERYPSMVELLAALRRDRRGRGRRWTSVLVGAGVATCGSVALAVWAGRADDPCAGGTQRVEETLGASGRAAAKATFEASALPFATHTWPAVEGALEAHADAWANAYTAMCEASRDGGPAEDTRYARRGACLQHRLDDAQALLAVFAQGETVALERALEAVSALSEPRECLNESLPSLDASDDPASADAWASLARIAALQRAGLTDEGLLAARAFVERTAASGDLRLRAEAHLWLAFLQRDASRWALAELNDQEALGLALRAGRDSLAAAAAVALVETVGRDEDRVREAEGWSTVASALLDRSAAPVQLRATFLRNRALLLEHSGRKDAARRPLREAADLLEHSYGTDDVRVASAWTALGLQALRAGDARAAAPLFERALGVVGATLGPHHPRHAALSHLLAEVALIEGDLDRASRALSQALAVRSALADQTAVAETLLLRAWVETARGDIEAAEATLLAVVELEALPMSVQGQAAFELSRLSLRRGRVDAAIRGAARSRAMLVGSDAAQQRLALDAVTADALLRRGELERAEVLIDESIRGLESYGGDASAALASPLTVRGELSLARGEPARALGDLERALGLRLALDAYGLARTEFALARALAAVDPRSGRARELGRQALRRLDDGEPLHAAVRGWLTDSSAPLEPSIKRSFRDVE